MAQVPYTGVPTVAPSERGLEVSTPPAAFGVETSQAISQLGRTGEQVGGELWQRAVALQQLKNETEAKDADIQFMLEIGEKHAKFNALEGQDRVNAFPGYSKDLQETYKRYRTGLSNDMSRRMFDSSAVSTMSRTIFNGAGAAATAQKEWSRSTNKSLLDINERQTFDDPTNDSEFNNRISRIRPAVRDLVATSPGGYSKEAEDDLSFKAESRLWFNRVLGLSRSSPMHAVELMDENKSKFTLDDWKHAEDMVRSQARTIGADNIAQNTLDRYRNDDGSYKKSFKEMQDVAREEADRIWAKRDPLMSKYTVAQLEHHYNQDNWAQRQDDAETKKQIEDTITAGARTMNQFPPDLVRKMNPAQRLQAQGMINNYLRSQHVMTNDDIYTKYLGLYNNDNTKFMETNVMGIEGINKSNLDFFLKLQRKAQGGDPRVGNAMKLLRGARGTELEALGVYSRNKNNPNDYDRLTGTMHEAIQAYQETHGKAPDEKAIVEQIWPTITQSVKTPGYLWGTNDTQFFKADIPEAAKKAIDADYEAAGRKPPEEPDYRREYSRMMFMKHFGPKETK